MEGGGHRAGGRGLPHKRECRVLRQREKRGGGGGEGGGRLGFGEKWETR